MESLPNSDAQPGLTVQELATFANKGQLPEAVLRYRQANNNQLPPQLYVPLGVIINADMAAQERAAALGRSLDARPSDDLRTALYTQDSIMQQLIDPFRLQRRELQEKPLTEVEQRQLGQGRVPASITGYVNDYQGELPAHAIKAVSDAVIQTTLERQGVMYPQFDLLYKRSLELPGLVDEPIRQGLKDQNLLPTDSLDWRRDMAQARIGSDATRLGIAEGVETQAMTLLLPAHAAKLRQYLEGDNYLSNAEVSRAIFDETTTRRQMLDVVATIDTTRKPDVREGVTDYLMELKASTQQFPAVIQLGPQTPIDSISLLTLLRNHSSDGPVLALPPPGDALRNVDLLERLKSTQPTPDAGDRLQSTQPIGSVESGNAPSLTDRIKRAFGLGSSSEKATLVQEPGEKEVKPIATAPGTTSSSLVPTETAGAFPKDLEKAAPVSSLVPGAEGQSTPGITPPTPPKATAVPERKDDDGAGLLTNLLKVKLFEGGMVANFLNNYEVVQELMNKLFSAETYGLRAKPKPEETPEKSVQATAPQQDALLRDLLAELDKRTRQPVLPNSTAQTPADRFSHSNTSADASGQKVPTMESPASVRQAAAEPQRAGMDPPPVVAKSLVSRLMDHFMDKLAVKVIERMAERPQTGLRSPESQLTGSRVANEVGSARVQMDKPTPSPASTEQTPVNPLNSARPATFDSASHRSSASTAQPNASDSLTNRPPVGPAGDSVVKPSVSETARQQEQYINAPNATPGSRLNRKWTSSA